jgi:hypothetical protein
VHLGEDLFREGLLAVKSAHASLACMLV